MHVGDQLLTNKVLLHCPSTVGHNSQHPVIQVLSWCTFTQRLALKILWFVLAIFSWLEDLCLVQFGFGITNLFGAPVECTASEYT